MESVANKKPCRTCGKNLHSGNPYEFQFECKNCLKYMEFQAICEIRLAEIEDILGEEYSLEKLKEMVLAEKEGRCVVLPCKLHDKVFFIENGCVKETEVDSFHNWTSGRWKLSTHTDRMFDHWKGYEIDFSGIGKIVFLTREEAEKALEGMEV